MANFVFTVAMGRSAELYNRVKTADPSAAELVVILLAASGIEADATLRDVATCAALVAGATNEATNTGYAKKVLAAGALAALDPDEANDRTDLDLPDQTWTALAADGTGAVAKLVVAYDPVGSQTMSDMIPMTAHDFAVTPDGSDVTAQIANFFRAQ